VKSAGVMIGEERCFIGILWQQWAGRQVAVGYFNNKQ